MPRLPRLWACEREYTRLILLRACAFRDLGAHEQQRFGSRAQELFPRFFRRWERGHTRGHLFSPFSSVAIPQSNLLDLSNSQPLPLFSPPTPSYESTTLSPWKNFLLQPRRNNRLQFIMATMSLDLSRLSAFSTIPENTLSTLVENPTTELVSTLLKAITEKAAEFERSKSQNLKLSVELENAVRASESKNRVLKGSVDKALKDAADLRNQLNTEGESDNGYTIFAVF